MQAEIIESSRIKKSLWDGPFGMSYSYQTISGAYNVPANAPPYMIALNAASAQNVTMYTPSVTTVMWCHEIWSAGAGTLTVKGTQGTTIGTIAAGKRGEIVWNPGSSPQDWTVFVSA